MKTLLKLVIFIVIGLLGYSFEPQLRGLLTSFAFLEKPRAKLLTTGLESEEPKIDLANVSASKFPSKIRLTKGLSLKDLATKDMILVSPGQELRYMSYGNGRVLVSLLDEPITGFVPLNHTNLEDLVAENLKNPHYSREEIPAPVAPTEPEKVVEKIKEVVVAEAPKPILDIMKASIQNSEVKEIKEDKVTDWVAQEAEEMFEGKSYRVGLLTYSAETVFGVKPMEAKAYILNNKVERWVGAKSGIQMK